MIHRIVQFALRQRFMVMMVTVLIIIAGAISFQRMPVDAYPDLSPPMVELITQWPGHAAEEVERLTTLPLELAMNGTPNLVVMRSISLYGLSDVILTFQEGTDPYFARNVVFQRIADATLPTGITPSMSPLFSPSGLVYRYVLESPDRSPQELHTFEDWVVERAYRVRARRGGRFRIRRHHHAISGGAGSRANLQLPHSYRAGNQRAFREQLQYRRRILFAGRTILLRSRTWSAAQRGRYRTGRRRQRKRRAGTNKRYRSRGNRPRAAPGRYLDFRKMTTPSKA